MYFLPIWAKTLHQKTILYILSISFSFQILLRKSLSIFVFFRYEIMKNCWKVIPSNRPTFSQIWQDLHDMLADNEVSSCMHRLFALYYNRNTLKIQNSWPKNKSKILNFRFQILSFTVNLIYWLCFFLKHTRARSDRKNLFITHWLLSKKNINCPSCSCFQIRRSPTVIKL